MVRTWLPFTDLRRAESRSEITADPSGRKTVDQGSWRPSILVRTTGAAGAVEMVRPGLADALPPGPVALPGVLEPEVPGEPVLPVAGALPPSPVHPASMSANATAAATVAARLEGNGRKQTGTWPSGAAERPALPRAAAVLPTLAAAIFIPPWCWCPSLLRLRLSLPRYQQAAALPQRLDRRGARNPAASACAAVRNHTSALASS